MAENFYVRTPLTPVQVARKVAEAGYFADARRLLKAEEKRQRKGTKRGKRLILVVTEMPK